MVSVAGWSGGFSSTIMKGVKVMNNRVIIKILLSLLVVACALIVLFFLAVKSAPQCDETACATFVEARVRALERENSGLKKEVRHLWQIVYGPAIPPSR